MRIAVLVDAAFFITRYRRLVPKGREHTGEQVAEALHRWACDHMQFDGSGSRGRSMELYRLFVYDCPPFIGKLENPISRESIDFSKSPTATFRTAFHAHLPKLRKVALRLGHLSEVRKWAIKASAMDQIIKGKRGVDSLGPDDVQLDVGQKGVDMRIGVDVASLAYKKLVDRIVLIAGDADFVPAAKLARREGIDFVLDSMHAHINASLYEHIDALVSMAPMPNNGLGSSASQPAKGYSVEYKMPVTPGSYTATTGANILRGVAILDHLKNVKAIVEPTDGDGEKS